MIPDELRELEPDFWRAPSAHNTQPWVLRYSDTAAEIGWDPACTLPAGDPTGRDLRLSLGAFAETCLIVCADAGLAVDFRPDFNEPARRIGYLVPATVPYVTSFTTHDVRRRISGRVTYRPGKLDDQIVAQLNGLAGGGQVRQLPCRQLIQPLQAADRHMFGTVPVARELRRWLRLTPRDPRYRQDGLTYRALGMSRPEAATLAMVLADPVYLVIRRLGLPSLLASASKGLLDYDGDVLILIAPPECDSSGQVEMGRVLMRQWLTLAGSGYTTHPLSQIIDFATTRQYLAHMLGIEDENRLLNLARVGYPVAQPAHSARRQERPRG
jgi:hypothetical protein